MDKRRNISKHSKDKFASGLLRGAAVSGLAAGLAAASLGGVPTASATCIGIFGINIGFGDGGGCTSSLFGFALGLGPNTVATSTGLLTAAIAVGFGNEQTELTQATSSGFFSLAYAGGPDTLAQTSGNLGVAVVQGENASAVAGIGTQFDNLNLAFNFGNGLDTGNPSFDPQTNSVRALGLGNIAANIFGNAIPGGEAVEPRLSMVQAGDDSSLGTVVGFANAAYNLFGDGNEVASRSFVPHSSPLFGLAFSVFGDRNDVIVTGPLAAGGALFQSDRFVRQTSPGININGVANDPGSTTDVLAAGSTQANRVGLNSTGSTTDVLAASGTHGNRVRLNSTGNNTNGVAASGTQGNRFRPSFNAAVNRAETTSPGARDSNKKWAKEHSDSASRDTSERTGDAEADADGTSNCDK